MWRIQVVSEAEENISGVLLDWLYQIRPDCLISSHGCLVCANLDMSVLYLDLTVLYMVLTVLSVACSGGFGGGGEHLGVAARLALSTRPCPAAHR